MEFPFHIGYGPPPISVQATGRTQTTPRPFSSRDPGLRSRTSLGLSAHVITVARGFQLTHEAINEGEARLSLDPPGNKTRHFLNAAGYRGCHSWDYFSACDLSFDHCGCKYAPVCWQRSSCLLVQMSIFLAKEPQLGCW